jgi:hypothetical protein
MIDLRMKKRNVWVTRKFGKLNFVFLREYMFEERFVTVLARFRSLHPRSLKGLGPEKVQEIMAQLLSVHFPENLTRSLVQLGRLDPQGRLIADDCTMEGGLKPAKELEGVFFQPIDLGYLGKYSIITCEGTRVLEPETRAKSLMKRLEKQVAERLAAEAKAEAPVELVALEMA